MPPPTPSSSPSSPPPPMAAPRPLSAGPPQRQQPQRPFLRCILFVFVALLLLLGVILLAIFLIVRPSSIHYSLDDIQIKNYNLTADTNTTNATLTSTFLIKLTANNQNRRVSVTYTSFRVSVIYYGTLLAYSDVAVPFRQPRRNVTVIEVGPAFARGVVLSDDVAGRLKRERSYGRWEDLEVRVDARVRFRVGVIRSRRYRMEVDCYPVVASFPPRKKGFEKVYCDVDI